MMLTRKERRAIANEAKRNVKKQEDDVRKQKHLDMLQLMSVKLLESFINDPRMNISTEFPVAVKVDIPLWDSAALLKDAQQLMDKFPAAVQYGGLHDGMWTTLCLRSGDGTTNNDSSFPSYKETQAWTESTYIVPHLLDLLKSTNPLHSSFIQRARLSIIPPNCNVGWHVDYENTHRDGPIRMHIPIQCSDGFMMNIGGRDVPMKAGETWLGQFELPHRLSNQKDGQVRIHLVVDLFPLSVTNNSQNRDTSILMTDIGLHEDDCTLPVVELIPVIPMEHVDSAVPVVIDISPLILDDKILLNLTEEDAVVMAPVLTVPGMVEVVETVDLISEAVSPVSTSSLESEIKPIVELLDWEPIRQSSFGRAIETAFHALYRDCTSNNSNDIGKGGGNYNVAETIAESVSAFSAYRWGGPFANTTEDRAAVEAKYYLK